MDVSEVRAAWERAARRAAAGEATPRVAESAAAGAAFVAPAFAGARRATRPEDLEGAGAVVLGIPCGGASGAPGAVRRASASCIASSGPGGVAGAWTEAFADVAVADYGDVAVVDADVEATFRRAHERLADIVAVGAVPLVLGGDHHVTVAALQVLSGMLSGRLGIVALDARLDLAFEPRYAPGSQWARALELGVVDPANVVVVGLQEDRQAPQEALVAEELGLRTYSTLDINALGIATVAQEALEVAAAGTEAIYVSLDLGVAGAGEPCDAPAVAGLGGREVVAAVRILATGRVAGFDVVAPACEGNLAGATARCAACAVAEVVAGLAAQRP